MWEGEEDLYICAEGLYRPVFVSPHCTCCESQTKQLKSSGDGLCVNSSEGNVSQYSWTSLWYRNDHSFYCGTNCLSVIGLAYCFPGRNNSIHDGDDEMPF